MSKPKPTYAEITQLFAQLIVPFYQVVRDTPLPFEPRRYENDAEHSWSLAVMACSLAPRIDPSLDVGLVCQFATVHDLTELHAGDTSVWAEQHYHDSKEEREAAALARIQADYAAFPWLTGTLAAYERQDTPEARFVKAVDKYVALLFDIIDEGGYYKEHKLTVQDFERTMAAHRQKAKAHPGVEEYYEEIWKLITSTPEYFHDSNSGATGS